MNQNQTLQRKAIYGLISMVKHAQSTHEIRSWLSSFPDLLNILIKRLEIPSREMVDVTLSLLGYLILRGSQEEVDQCLRLGLLDRLGWHLHVHQEMVSENHDSVLLNITWILMNIAASGDTAHLQLLLDQPHLLSRLFNLREIEDKGVRKHCLWFLQNLVSAATVLQWRQLLALPFPSFPDLLQLNLMVTNDDLLWLAVDTVLLVMIKAEEAGQLQETFLSLDNYDIFNLVQDLKNHNNAQISRRANDVFDQFDLVF